MAEMGKASVCRQPRAVVLWHRDGRAEPAPSCRVALKCAVSQVGNWLSVYSPRLRCSIQTPVCLSCCCAGNIEPASASVGWQKGIVAGCSWHACNEGPRASRPADSQLDSTDPPVSLFLLTRSLKKLSSTEISPSTRIIFKCDICWPRVQAFLGGVWEEWQEVLLKTKSRKTCEWAKLVIPR